MGFYIRYETHQDGPFDLITMIRKIRKGLLPPETLVMEEKENHAQPARLHPLLNSFFREMDEDYVSDEASGTVQHINFKEVINTGWDFFTHNLIAGLAGGLFVLVTGIYSLIILIAANGSFLPSVLLIGVAGAFFLCGFIYLLQQMHRHLPFSLNGVLEFYQQHWNNLALFSLTYCALIVAGLSLFIVPGIVVLAFTAFAPILVVDRQEHFWHAIESSVRTVRLHGSRLSSILLAMVGINALAAMLVFPLIITLPVTFISLIDLYNRLDFT